MTKATKNAVYTCTDSTKIALINIARSDHVHNLSTETHLAQTSLREIKHRFIRTIVTMIVVD